MYSGILWLGLTGSEGMGCLSVPVGTSISTRFIGSPLELSLPGLVTWDGISILVGSVTHVGLTGLQAKSGPMSFL